MRARVRIRPPPCCCRLPAGAAKIASLTHCLPCHQDRHADRRLSRRQGRRSVPLAGRSRLVRHTRMDRGGEQGHVRLSRRDSGPRRDQAALDRNLELRTLTLAAAVRRPLFLYAQRRLAEPGRAATSPIRSTRSRACCSIRTRLSADGTIALKGYAISDDGKYIAYGLSAAARIGKTGTCSTSPAARTPTTN